MTQNVLEIFEKAIGYFLFRLVFYNKLYFRLRGFGIKIKMGIVSPKRRCFIKQLLVTWRLLNKK